MIEIRLLVTLGGQHRRQSLDANSQFIALAHVPQTNAPYENAAVGDADRKAFVDQSGKCFAQRRAADATSCRDLFFDQPLAGLELAGDDPTFDLVGDSTGQRLVLGTVERRESDRVVERHFAATLGGSASACVLAEASWAA